MDVESLRKTGSLQTWGRDEGRKGWSLLPSFVLVRRRLWFKSASPRCCHLTCLHSVYLFLPLSVLPLAFCWCFCHPFLPLHFLCPRRNRKKEVFCAPREIYCLWSPFMASSAPLLSPQPQITPTSHLLNVSEASFFETFSYISWGRLHTSRIH